MNASLQIKFIANSIHISHRYLINTLFYCEVVVPCIILNTRLYGYWNFECVHAVLKLVKLNC